MEHYRRTSHTRFDIKYHFVWVTKYRKRLLSGAVGQRLRKLVRDICGEHEVKIIKGHISSDHVHLFVSCPPHISPSHLMQKVKGKTSRKIQQEFSHIKRECWGRYLWARGFFVASSGNVTDEMIMEYIEHQEITEENDNFKIED
jgi:putative transposase